MKVVPVITCSLTLLFLGQSNFITAYAANHRKGPKNPHNPKVSTVDEVCQNTLSSNDQPVTRTTPGFPSPSRVRTLGQGSTSPVDQQEVIIHIENTKISETRLALAKLDIILDDEDFIISADGISAYKVTLPIDVTITQVGGITGITQTHVPAQREALNRSTPGFPSPSRVRTRRQVGNASASQQEIIIHIDNTKIAEAKAALATLNITASDDALIISDGVISAFAVTLPAGVTLNQVAAITSITQAHFPAQR